jgi:phage terminase small subunit
MKISDKQKRFCEEYLKDLNATEAAIRTGYSPTSAAVSGHRNMQNKFVIEYLNSLRDEIKERSLVDEIWVLKKLTTIVERSLQEEPVNDNKGNFTGVYKYDSAGANRALELIGKHLGMFKENIVHSGQVEIKHKLFDD